MTRQEYTAQVLAQLRRVTGDERESIRAEIDAHMEDHIRDLLDLGYAPELAEERTLAFMGDPAEVGRELSKQYPLGWLAARWFATAVTVLLCAAALSQLWGVTWFWGSLKARVIPNRFHSQLESQASEWVDIRVRIGNDVLRVYQVNVGTEDGRQVAEVSLCAYDCLPGGIVTSDLLRSSRLEDQRGGRERPDTLTAYNGSDGRTAYGNTFVTIGPEDTYVTLRYERLGRHLAIQIPLPEEVAP
nr:permease prefix domain 1-containing protein [uncultured Oscillibacter sp.]